MILHDIEQRSPEWYRLRAGMPTASEFSKIITSKGDPSKQVSGYAMTLAAELYAGKPVDAWEGNVWTERGRELEAKAIAVYEFATDAEVTHIGFVTDDEKTMGCSPDGLVGDDGLVEVKCLKAENHIAAILYYQKHGRCPPGYVQQTQGQLLICGRKWDDLIFYHPELPPLIVRQTPDPAIQRALLNQIPDLLSERDAVLAHIRAQRDGNTLTDCKTFAPVKVDLTQIQSIF